MQMKPPLQRCYNPSRNYNRLWGGSCECMSESSLSSFLGKGSWASCTSPCKERGERACLCSHQPVMLAGYFLKLCCVIMSLFEAVLERKIIPSPSPNFPKAEAFSEAKGFWFVSPINKTRDTSSLFSTLFYERISDTYNGTWGFRLAHQPQRH